MPFEPLTPAEQEKIRPPCTYLEHNPPSHMVITQPMKWICLGCGKSVIISPPIIHW